MTLRVYIAAPYSLGSYCRAVVQPALEEIGSVVCSSWHATANGPEDLVAMSQEERARIIAANASDLDAADIVLAIVEPGLGKEMFAECARALMCGKDVVWIGKQRHMPLSAWSNPDAIVATLNDALRIFAATNKMFNLIVEDRS